MATIRWTPAGNLASFQHEMNRMFNDVFRGGNGDESDSGIGTWTPPVDIYEIDEALMIKAELPGVSKDDVSVDVHENTLTLRGQRKPDAGIQQDRYHRAERTYGTFQRSFVLPATIDQDKVQASFKDGVLELHLPKSDRAKPRRITING